MNPFAPQDAQTVTVRVQVIDMDPFALDLQVPTYIAARDLTQRVARDAGLGAYWDDGTRRLFWLRARGRVVNDDEKLEMFGVVPGELLHLLPQPPAGSGVVERPPEYPQMHGYAGAGWINVVTSLLGLFGWAVAWAIVLTASCNPITGIFPSIGLAVLSTSFSRHLWGSLGSAFKIPAVGVVVYTMLFILAILPAAVLIKVDPQTLAIALVPGFFAGLGGVLIAWLAWFGPVEPVQRQNLIIAQMQVTSAGMELQCGICGNAIEESVRQDCVFKCGRVFHNGCYRARQGMAPQGTCAICGYRAA